MGTLSDQAERAGLKIRDTNRLQFSKTERLGLFNDILEQIYQKLVFVESNLVYAESTITTVADTIEYTPSFSHNGFMHKGVWINGEDTYLGQVEEADKIKYDYGTTTNKPEVYYLAEDGKVGFLWVPDDAYTVHIQYWEPITELTDYDNDDLPWGGIFNRYIQRMLVWEMKEILEMDSSRDAAMSQMELNQAMNIVYLQGIRHHRQASDFFSIGNI